LVHGDKTQDRLFMNDLIRQSKLPPAASERFRNPVQK
jgi:hypothetical protein